MKTEREPGGSLFERIGEAASFSVNQSRKMTLLRSIMLNLQNILNSRSGSSYGSPDIGLPDLNDELLASTNIRDATSQIVKKCVLRYEPRISDITINANAQDVNAPLELRYHILAQVHFHTQRDVLEFDILLDSHQRWYVE